MDSTKTSDQNRPSDAVFCRSCGHTIKSHAEICPCCGVRIDLGKRRMSGTTIFFIGLGMVWALIGLWVYH